MITHLQAKQIVDSLGLTPAESLYLRAVAFSESQYGNGWGFPTPLTIQRSQEKGLTGYEGKDSNNWGAETGVGDAGSFPHVDTKRDGTVYVGNYRKWSSPEKGASSVAKVLLKPNVRAALSLGNLYDVVKVQINENYYTGNPPATPADLYFRRVVDSLDTIVRATGESNPLAGHPTPVATGSGSASLLLASASLLTACDDVTKLNTLRRDVAGPDVAFLQYKLGGLKIDGWFGPMTEAAVMKKQRELGVKVDGIVGPKTWTVLR